MTAAPSSLAASRPGPASGWVTPLAIVAGLATIVGVRALAVRAGLDPLVVGTAFGGALVLLALLALAGRQPAAGRARAAGRTPAGRVRTLRPGPIVASTAFGVVVGLVLVAVAVAGPSIGGVLTVPGIGRPAAPFLPWALITLIVAAGEEGVLRGVLFDRIERVAGLAPAIALTTIAFALMHVPLYGWHVVPLDLAVGLVFAGLRISTRGLAAPIAAHALADLATWWL